MSVIYSGGTYVNTTFTPTTKQDIVTALENALVAAGWAVISGSGTAAVELQSATTSQGLAVRVVIADLGGTTKCATVFLKHTSGSPSSNIAYLYPSGVQYRIIASRYGFLCQTDRCDTTAREHVMAGNLWAFPRTLPLVGATLAFLIRGGETDTTTTGMRTLRNTFEGDTAGNGTSGNSWLVDALVYNGGSNSIYNYGVALPSTLAIYSSDLWPDGGWFGTELVLTGAANRVGSKTYGVVYDLAVSPYRMPFGATYSFDNHPWRVVGVTADVSANRGSILMVTG